MPKSSGAERIEGSSVHLRRLPLLSAVINASLTSKALTLTPIAVVTTALVGSEYIGIDASITPRNTNDLCVQMSFFAFLLTFRFNYTVFYLQHDGLL